MLLFLVFYIYAIVGVLAFGGNDVSSNYQLPQLDINSNLQSCYSIACQFRLPSHSLSLPISGCNFRGLDGLDVHVHVRV
jgi:hypothetical protein